MSSALHLSFTVRKVIFARAVQGTFKVFGVGDQTQSVDVPATGVIQEDDVFLLLWSQAFKP